MFRRLLHRIGIRRPMSIDWEDAGRECIAAMARGIEQAQARHAELAATGMTEEEIQVTMLREQYADPAFHQMLAHAEGVVRRSFPEFED